jgi:hypothetical protein
MNFFRRLAGVEAGTSFCAITVPNDLLLRMPFTLAKIDFGDVRIDNFGEKTSQFIPNSDFL